MDNYKEYIFTIGEAPNQRIYKGRRMPPKPDGFEFGYKFRSEIQDVLLSLTETETQQVMHGEFGALIRNLTAKFKPEVILKYWNTVLNHQDAGITAKEDGKNKTYVFSNDVLFNEWFSMYPEDLTEVMYTCVWENASPFLLVSWRKALTEIKEHLKKQSAEDETPAASS